MVVEQGFRHEYKYYISKASAKLLKYRLPHFMQRDPHAGTAGCYTIRSLYFDDPNFTAFHDKMDGLDHRTKYRIRCYNYDTSVLRLEKKEKVGDLTRKKGQTITLSCALQLQNEPGACAEKGLAEELRIRCSAGMRPVVLVDYDRTPFVCAAGNTRITLDENLRTLPYCADLQAKSHGMVPVLEDGLVVLEVKFDDYLPGYLSDVLADIPKAPMAISKFAMCLNLD